MTLPTTPPPPLPMPTPPPTASVHPATVTLESHVNAGAAGSVLKTPPPPPISSTNGPSSLVHMAALVTATSPALPNKEDEVRSHDVLPAMATANERCELEGFTPFSRSHLWRLMMSFYDRQGVESWAQGIVPHFITSNTFIARKYSAVLRAYLRDMTTTTSGKNANKTPRPTPLDPTQPLYIIELGTGSGKFSFYFLKALAEAEDTLDFPIDQIRYIMTDFTEQNFNFWTNHPALAPFVSRGIVDFAIFDATKDTELRLHNSKVVLRPQEAVNPIGIIANYLFDTLYHDLFQVEAGMLKEGLVSVGSKRAEEPDPLDPEIIKRLSNIYKYEPIDEMYYGEEHPHLNNILKWYHEYYDPASSGATILVPIGALTAIDRLSQLSKDHRMFILSGDKGNNNPDHFRGVTDPHIAVHGSFSVMVNYHAIGIYIASRGGFALHSPQEEASLKVSLFVLPGAKSEEPTLMNELHGDGLDDVCERRSRVLPHLRRAFEEEIVAFGPNDFFVMQKTLKEETKTPSLKSVLALLKLSGWDPDTFYKFRDVLLDHSPTCAPKLKRDVRYGIPLVWKNYYALDKEKDIAFEVGRLYYGIHDYDSALAFYTLSMQEMGKHHVTSHNMGLCYYSKRQLQLAASCFEEAFTLNSSYQKAATWLQRVQKELGVLPPVLHTPSVGEGSDCGAPAGPTAQTPDELIVQQIELVMSDHEEETARPSLSRLSLDDGRGSPRSGPRPSSPSRNQNPQP